MVITVWVFGKLGRSSGYNEKHRLMLGSSWKGQSVLHAKSSFPARILGWLAGVLLCLVATAVWAQPPDFGLPLGGGRQGGFWGRREGRVPNSMPALPPRGPIARPSCSLWPPCRREPIPIRSRRRRADRWRTTITVDQSPTFPSSASFKTVGLPKIEHDEVAFPGLVLESHSGTVKWVARIQFAAGVKPGDGQDPRQRQDAIVR